MPKTKAPTKAQTGLAAAYIRVSSLDQGEKYSLPSQLKALRDLATRLGKQIPEDWIFSDKHTGKLESRPSFDKLKTLVKTGQPDQVLIYDVSRFARKTLDALWLMSEFKRHGVELRFVELPYEDTPTGRLTFTQLAAVAEYVGEKIIDDAKRGRRDKLENGLLDGGCIPDGFKNNTGRIEIDAPRAEIWKEIFRKRGIERKAKYQIAADLNNAGIPTAKGRRWKSERIERGLSNRAYIGEFRRAGITLPCPAIIDRQLFDDCQKFNDESRQKYIGRPSSKYLLSGFLYCGKCQYRMRTKAGHKTGKRINRCSWYICGNMHLAPYQRLCPAKIVYQDVVEDAAWREIWRALTDADFLYTSAEAYFGKRSQKPQTNELATLSRQRAELADRIETTRRMMQDRAMPYARGLSSIREDEARLAQIDEQIRAAGQEVLQLPTKHQLAVLLREIAKGPEPGSDATTREEAYSERRPILERIRGLKMHYYKHQLTIEGQILFPAKSTTSKDHPVEKKSPRCQDTGGIFFPQPGVVIPFRINTRVA